MNRLRKFLTVALLLSLAVPAVRESSAAETKFAVIDMMKLFGEYKGTKEKAEKFKQQAEAKRSEREKLVSDIKNMREQLSLLNEQARSEKQGLMEEKLKTLAKFDRETSDELTRERDEERGEIFQEIESVAADYAKKNGYDFVLQDQALVYSPQSVDITDEVLLIMNERYGKKR